MTSFDSLLQQHGCLFLPDIGTFFNNNISQALSLVDSLSESQIPVLKAEILHDIDICLNGDFQEHYYSSIDDRLIYENYRSLIERKIVSLDSYKRIFNHAKCRGMSIIVSVYDEIGASFAVSEGCIALKLASSNITNDRLIRYLSSVSLPIIIDTGHSTLEEIARTVNIFNDLGKYNLVIQHSPLAPPAPVDQHNLLFMKTLSSSFGVPVGLSDHHITEEMLYAAVALGASVVEKGVCPDELGDEQDRAHALNISQARIVNYKINNIVQALGTGYRHLNRDRIKYRARMCIYACRNIAKGDLFSHENTDIAFPLDGVGSEFHDDLVGLVSLCDIPKGSPIKPSHFKVSVE